ncbi:molybdopterin-binding protein [Thalassococcus sp. S3]|uniref:molybdopterin-binding protein n=1 Tax=Thalassococcus sp. S3 TaxID=2017482 RepID=UPI00102453D8|nr:molybdopterin-binding protein [Thalassococcus sp. S3]QBF31408.1 molybdopterin biosynthesis protein [Thalassococcus sp. S3]
MKFGPVPLAEAEGAILAHSVRAGARKLRKGMTLGPEEIAALEAAGLSDVIAARLCAGDLHENAAAARLAAALVPDPGAVKLRLTEAFTGRVNVIADSPGVALLDVAALEAANRIDPMITVATVPPFQQMQTGGMVATIKIISYAVSQADVAQACAASGGAIRLAAPQLATAALVVTDIPGGPPNEKGIRAVSDRVSALGLKLQAPIIVPHREDELAAALARSDADLSLVLTGSATSDRDDVAPAAVRAAGGRVDRFGMPVDPGNLLFIGALNGRPVIGLPGCARSPALNGADWVLSRVVCGIPVGHEDIAAMGVGGLLKEIPTRPQPRSAPRRS